MAFGFPRQKKRSEELLHLARSTGEDALATFRSSGGEALSTARSVGGEALSTARSAGEEALSTARSASDEALTAVGEYLLRRRAPVRTRGSGEDAWAFIAGLVFGALVAGAAAVLLAPTDGQTLRARLRAKLDELLGRNEPEPYMPAQDLSSADDQPAENGPVSPVTVDSMAPAATR